MARSKLLDSDGNVDVDAIGALRRGELVDAYDDLIADLAAAKEAHRSDPSARTDTARAAAADRVANFRRWQRTERPDLLLDGGAVNVTPTSVGTGTSTMKGG